MATTHTLWRKRSPETTADASKVVALVLMANTSRMKQRRVAGCGFGGCALIVPARFLVLIWSAPASPGSALRAVVGKPLISPSTFVGSWFNRARACVFANGLPQCVRIATRLFAAGVIDVQLEVPRLTEETARASCMMWYRYVVTMTTQS